MEDLAPLCHATIQHALDEAGRVGLKIKGYEEKQEDIPPRIWRKFEYLYEWTFDNNFQLTCDVAKQERDLIQLAIGRLLTGNASTEAYALLRKK